MRCGGSAGKWELGETEVFKSKTKGWTYLRALAEG